ncbi:MAG: hypothetical protein ACRD11_17190 [Terriglobia bacterium]
MNRLSLVAASMVLPFATAFAGARRPHADIHIPAVVRNGINCDWESSFCSDLWTHKDSWGYYSGHDEPSLAFYSNQPGSGNNLVYNLTIPSEPPTPPAQDGSGGTDNFQLQPVFWIGMAMCDTQSAPNYTQACTPNSDSNIYNNPDPAASDYIGRHPGTADMELQFFAPGWVEGCSPTVWCVELTVDSYSFDNADNRFNNQACRDTIGDEPVNNTYLTFDGIPLFPANPLRVPYGASIFDTNEIFFMFPGDQVQISFHDTPLGLRVVVYDVTQQYAGFMTAGPQNGFAQVVFNPQGNGCALRPYAFHPMYSTSTPATRVTWAAHTFNVAFSGELGHFEYCSAVDANGNCTAGGDPGVDQNGKPSMTADADDQQCFVPGSPFLPPGDVQIAGCIFNDIEFDGPSYGLNWPGTETPPALDMEIHPSSIQFNSPVFFNSSGDPENYSQVAFETNLPGIETQSTPACDTKSGTNCVNPPPGAAFYPIYTTNTANGRCVWQLGGAQIPGTTNTFGGDASAEYGPPSAFVFPIPGTNASVMSYQDFHRMLGSNPCKVNLSPSAEVGRKAGITE